MQTEDDEEEEEVKAVNCGESDDPLETRDPHFREGTAAESKETSSGSRRTSRCSTPMSLHLELSEDESDSPILSSEEVSDLDEKRATLLGKIEAEQAAIAEQDAKVAAGEAARKAAEGQ